MKRKRCETFNPLKRKFDEHEFLKRSRQRIEGNFNYTVHDYQLMILKLVAQNKRLLDRLREAEARLDCI